MKQHKFVLSTVGEFPLLVKRLKMDAKLELQPDLFPLEANDTNKKNIRWTVFFAAFSVNLYMVVVGMVESYSAPATVDMMKPGSRFKNVTPDQITWIASLPVLGCGAGFVVSGYTSQIFGRRATLVLMSPLYVLSWLMIAYAPTISFIYAGRLLCGFFFGIGCVAVPAYATEISPVRIRGRLGSINYMSYSVGCFIMILLAYIFRWSWLAVSGAAFVTLSASLVLFLPESPEWLLRNSRITEAIQSLRFFHGRHLDLEKELESVSQNLDAESKTKFNWRQFREPNLYKPLLISLSMAFFSKFAGINIINSYTVQIFQNIGSVIDPQTSTAMFAAVHIIANIFTSLLVDRAGRRILYITSGAFMTVALIAVGLYDYLGHLGYDLSGWHWVPLISLFVYIGFYSFGIGPMGAIMTPEMVTIASRSTVIAIVLAFSSVQSFVLTKLFNVMVMNLQYYGMFWFFGVFTFLATLFGIFVLPETKGRTIDDINNSFRTRSIQ